MAKERVDILVQRQEGVSRSEAQGLVLTGKVFGTDGRRFEKPGERIDDATQFVVKGRSPYVSRGGLKLDAALDRFDIDVTGEDAIDVGASTGGFTDCLLQRGANRVCAVDVGYGQLAWTLRSDPRVTVMERQNVRELKAADLPFVPTFFTADCSFISLRLVLPILYDICASKARGVVLIKPQFEAGKDQVGKGGVVRDPEVRRAAVEGIVVFADEIGFDCGGECESPLQGPAGNIEYLVYLIKRGEGDARVDSNPELRAD